MEKRASRSPGNSADAAEFAQYLREERERRQITLHQIADETKIAHHHLVALERGDVRHWPGGMYRRAMMRAYAESIGVDREFALAQFERAFDTAGTRDVDSRRPAAPSPRAAQPAAPPGRRKAADAGRAMASFTAAANRVVTAGVDRAAALIVAAREAARSRQAGVRRPGMIAAAVLLVLAAGAAFWSVRREPVSQPQQAVAPVPVPETSRPVEPPAAEPVTATSGTAVEPARPQATDGQLVVTSTPAGARVIVNGIGWGHTPVTIRYLEFGEKRVRVMKDGYVSRERLVRLDPQQPTATLQVTLSPQQR